MCAHGPKNVFWMRFRKSVWLAINNAAQDCPGRKSCAAFLQRLSRRQQDKRTDGEGWFRVQFNVTLVPIVAITPDIVVVSRDQLPVGFRVVDNDPNSRVACMRRR